MNRSRWFNYNPLQKQSVLGLLALILQFHPKSILHLLTFSPPFFSSPTNIINSTRHDCDRYFFLIPLQKLHPTAKYYCFSSNIIHYRYSKNHVLLSRQALQALCHLFISFIDILINSLAACGNADFIVALRQFRPESIPYQIIHSGFCFLLVSPMVKL